MIKLLSMFDIFIYFLIDMDTMQQIIFDGVDVDDHVWQTTVHTIEIMSEYYFNREWIHSKQGLYGYWT